MKGIALTFSARGLGWRRLLSYFLFALGFALTLPFSQWVFRQPLKLWWFLILVPVATIVAFVVLVILDNLTRKHAVEVAPHSINASSAGSQGDRKLFWFLFAAIAAVYILNFLYYYPGCATTDANAIVREALGLMQLTLQQSLLYQVLVSIILHFGLLFMDLEGSLALLSLIQILVVATAFAHFLCWLKGKGIPQWVFVVCLLFFVLNPIIARYSITIWQDIPFSLCLLMLAILLFDVAQSRGALLDDKKVLIKLLIICFGVLFFRKNGLIVVAGVALFLLFWLWRKNKIPAVGLSILIGISVILQGPVFTSMGVEGDHFIETAALPMQQIANVVYKGEQLTEEQAETIFNIIPEDAIREYYSYRSPDPMKYSGFFDRTYMDAHKVEFLKVWLQLMPSHLRDYLQVWGSQSYGYWCIGIESWYVATGGFSLQESTNIVADRTGAAWTNAGTLTDYEDIRIFPALYPLFNVGCMVWMTLAVALLCSRKAERWKIICLIPALLLIFTMMFAAPTLEFRYVFSLHLSLPLILTLPFIRKGNAEETTEESTEETTEESTEESTEPSVMNPDLVAD